MAGIQSKFGSACNVEIALPTGVRRLDNEKIHCNWQCTPRLHQRAALLLCALHARVWLRRSTARLLYSNVQPCPGI